MGKIREASTRSGSCGVSPSPTVKNPRDRPTKGTSSSDPNQGVGVLFTIAIRPDLGVSRHIVREISNVLRVPTTSRHLQGPGCKQQGHFPKQQQHYQPPLLPRRVAPCGETGQAGNQHARPGSGARHCNHRQTRMQTQEANSGCSRICTTEEKWAILPKQRPSPSEHPQKRHRTSSSSDLPSRNPLQVPPHKILRSSILSLSLRWAEKRSCLVPSQSKRGPPRNPFHAARIPADLKCW